MWLADCLVVCTENLFLLNFPLKSHTISQNPILILGAVTQFYRDFERFKNTARSYIAKMVLVWTGANLIRSWFGKHHSANDNNPLGSEDG